MEFVISGQLKEWLEADGRHDLVDAGTVEVDPEDLKKLEAECRKHHPHYSPELTEAWAIFSIVTRKQLSKEAQNAIGADSSNGVGRVAAAVEGQTREFRALKGAFDQQHSKIGAVEAAVGESAIAITRAICTNGAADGLKFDALQDEIVHQFTISRHTASLQALKDENLHFHDWADARTERKWLWAWRAAILLALIGLLAFHVHAEPEPANVIDRAQVLNALAVGPRVFAQFSGTTSHMYFYNGSNWVPAATGTPFPVTCISGCSAAGVFSDNSAFTVGTSAVSPIGAYYTSGAAPTLSSGNAARVRMDSNSYLYVDCVTGCSGGATTPADGFTNPTTAGLSLTFNAGYNGSTWDLLRSGDKNNVTGVTGVLNTAPVGRYNATQPTLTDTRYNLWQLSSRGELLVSPGVSGFAVTATLAAETTKVIGTVNQGTSPWVISGALTDTQIRATPLPVSGTVTVTDGSGALNVIVDSGSTVVTQPTGTSLHAVLDTTSTTAVTQATGTNLHAVLDTTSTTAVTQATGTNLHAVLDSGTTTVTQATGTNLHTVLDSGTVTTVGAVTAITNALPAGSNLIGHVVADSGSTTAVTGNVTATQATGSNLHVVVDTAPSTAVTGTFYPYALGNTTMSGSVPVTMASDQSAIPISAASLPLPSGAATAANQTTEIASLAALDASFPPLLTNQMIAVQTQVAPNLVYNTGQGKPNGYAALYGALGAGEYNSILPTLSYGQAAHTQMDRNGRLLVSLDAITKTIPAAIQDASGIKPVYDPCQSRSKQFNSTSTAAGGTVALNGMGGVASSRYYFCSWIDQNGGTALNYAVIEGTTSCTVGITAVGGLSGGTTAATGWNEAIGGNHSIGNGSAAIAATGTAGDGVCVILSGTTQVNFGYSFVVAP